MAEKIGVDPRQLRRVAVASAIGTTIEWYDFFIFSTAVPLVFNTLFFSDALARVRHARGLRDARRRVPGPPVGGVVWGHFGDRVGRKAMLVASLVLMGAATVGVGLLPTYAQIGVLAPILLVVLRLLQGISAGGEWAGAALMAVEHAPPGKRGAYGSFSQIGVPAGLILAQLLFLAVTAATTPEQFDAWGWRLPFLFSIVLVVVGLVVRLSLAESPVFTALRASRRAAAGRSSRRSAPGHASWFSPR